MRHTIKSQAVTNLPKTGIFNAIELQNNMIFTVRNQQQRCSLDGEHRPSISKTAILKRNKNCQQIVLMNDVCIYEAQNNYISNNNDQKYTDLGCTLLTNELNWDCKNILQKSLKDEPANISIVSLNQIDYCQNMDNQHFLTGKLCDSSFNIIKKDKFNQFLIQKQLNLNSKHIYDIKKLNNSSAVISYNSSQNTENTPGTVEGICCYDLQVQHLYWKYSKKNQIFTNSIPINNFCIAFGHYFMNGNQFDLILYDVRQNSIASILDSSRDQFGGVSDFPHYNMLYKINDWQLMTVWGPPACSTSKIIKLDIRFPMRKQILLKDIPHPKFIFKSKIKPKQFWLIRNQYQSYRFVRSIIQSFQFDY